jgi:quercetin dioxygenase-like cupin family protein
MPEWTKKAWGRTMRCQPHLPFTDVHLLEVEAGGYSSWHYHPHQTNLFLNVSAEVRVIYKLLVDRNLSGRVLSNPGDSILILANIPHQFQVISSGVMMELYSPVEGDVGIVRLGNGGIDVAASNGVSEDMSVLGGYR